ncbi:MAG: glycosyltransferase family 2 protein [Clostridium sp.]|nr:glycosyltransferase family 2 protein [Clostridium sp.]
MRLSIIIPLYNKETFIANTLESVLSSCFDDFEVLVVNDGSTDRSQYIVEQIKDSRLRLINKPNEGVSATRNRGINEAKGDYICLIDADDILLSGAIEEFSRMVNDSGKCSVLIASYVEKNNEGKIVKSCVCKDGIITDAMYALWHKDIYPRMGNVFIKRTFIQEVGMMRTDLTLYEDKEWILRLLRNSSVYGSSKVLLEYRRCAGGLSFNMPSIKNDFAGIVRLGDVKNKYERLIVGDFLMRRLIRRMLAKDVLGVLDILKLNWKYLHIMIWAFISK